MKTWIVVFALLAPVCAYAQINNSPATFAQGIGTGSTPATACGSATGCLALGSASTAGSPVAGQTYCRNDSGTGFILCSVNGGSEVATGINQAMTGAYTMSTHGSQLTLQDSTNSPDAFVINLLDNGTGGSNINFDPTIKTAGQGAAFRFCRTFNDTGACTFTVFQGNNTSTAAWAVNGAGRFLNENGEALAGMGHAYIRGATSQKSETASADASVLAVTPSATAATYRVNCSASVSAATSGVIGFTLSWTDSNGTAQSNIALSLLQAGTAAPANTFTTSAAGNYSCIPFSFDINNAAAAVTVKWVGGGTTTAKVSSSIQRMQ